ncbi:MAG: penicillin-binding protein 2 [Gammaproteobacteria bacterium]|nr:penicillin-binding protein 2 [Gammaproteobacteria bacterium]
MSRYRDTIRTERWRLRLVLGVMVVGAGLLTIRALYMQVLDNGFLRGQGDARHLRTVTLQAHRGMIQDRHGEPLAISTPVDSVWANPAELLAAGNKLPRLARLMNMDVQLLRLRLQQRSRREFVFLKRHINPDLARQIMALELPGVALQREYRRYYPAGEVAAHVLGFTNVDDSGQEGAELAYDRVLAGTPGRRRVIKDRYGHIVEDVEGIREPIPGSDLRLSIDRDIQYLAYRELKAAVGRFKARSGSVVVLDVRNGEVLAMVNQPSFNPNNRISLTPDKLRNRAVTDLFEPGSTIKPFTIAAALESGQYRPQSRIDTSPGQFRIGHAVIRDKHDYGVIDLTTVLQKSSNVGVSKVSLSLEPRRMWNMLSRVGFGTPTQSGLPGEMGGELSDYASWREVDRATVAYGYGLSVTPLQLARSYSILANRGHMVPVSMVPVGHVASVEQVLSSTTAQQLVAMMESVMSEGGTGTLATVAGYRVSGKTGTVQKFSGGEYSENYVALFAGIAPASNPRLVAVVVIDEPGDEEYYGGQVAAPVFSKVMAGALRIMGVSPDDVLRQEQGPAAVDGRGLMKVAAARRRPL